MFESIVSVIDAEIARLQHARALLTDLAAPAQRASGRGPAKAAAGPKKSKRRTISPEARERMRQAQLARRAREKKQSSK